MNTFRIIKTFLNIAGLVFFGAIIVGNPVVVDKIFDLIKG